MNETNNNKEDLKKVEEGLARNQLFTGLEDFYLKGIISRGEVRNWPAGTQIITEGDPGDAVFFIISGRVKVTLYGEEGREIVLAILNEGVYMFGAMSIIDDKPRSANVDAVQELVCLVVTKGAFLDYMSRHHKVYMRFFAYLTGRLREATARTGSETASHVLYRCDSAGGADIFRSSRPHGCAPEPKRQARRRRGGGARARRGPALRGPRPGRLLPGRRDLGDPHRSSPDPAPGIGHSQRLPGAAERQRARD